jgi:GWxTD domain-containing protein
MKRLLYCIVLLAFGAHGQALRDMNFNYWYNPESLLVKIKPVRSTDNWLCYYSIRSRDTTISDVQVRFEIRTSLTEKEGAGVTDENIKANTSGRSEWSGLVQVRLSSEIQYLVASITEAERSYYYYVALEPNYPETRVLTSDARPITERFVKVKTPLAVQSSERFIVSRYDDNFPTAPLAFSEALGKVSKGMKVDSTFAINGNDTFSIERTGLYLIQNDTMSAEGISFRAEVDYPRYSKLKNLAAPLVYICTNAEFEKIKAANGDKKQFDKVILSITRDTDRAKKLIRSYFKRIESANEFFTSYKEGWKTDRGMIYIIFGPPSAVHRFTDREVWSYKNSEFDVSFDFTRSPSIFDPHNYVLIRDKKYTQVWYEIIDLWRNARF